MGRDRFPADYPDPVATEAITAQLKALPKGPGVYLFRDERDDVLYVGKAKSLRSRVRQYFQAGRSDNRLGMDTLVERVDRIETIVTGSEVEALHLEQNLVKRHRPPFNVRLRDDKSFPYIAVTLEDDYPRVMFTRKRHRRGVLYFGPYANAKKVRETLDVLNRVFRYRPCEGPSPGRRSGIPCLDYHIERCLAPCVGYVTEGGLPRGDRRRGRVPLRKRQADPHRARAADARRGDGGAVRGRGELPQPPARGRAARRAPGGRARLDRDDRRDRARDRARARSRAGLPAAERADDRPLRVSPRERRRRRPARGARGVLHRVLRRGAVGAAADPRPARARRPRHPRRLPLRAARVAGRGARARARREAPAAGARAAQRRARALVRHAHRRDQAAAARRGARGAA